MGFITMCIVVMIAFGGLVLAIVLNTLRWNTALILRMKLGHKVNFTSYLISFRFSDSF